MGADTGPSRPAPATPAPASAAAGAAATSPRAAVLVTGTELLSGRRADRNGPWLARRLRAAGIELAQVSIVPDSHDEILRALRAVTADGVDLIVTSGGLGPTADDLTVQAVAELHGAPMVLDTSLEERIAAIVAPLRERFPGSDPEALAVGTRKQATVPEGAIVLGPAGTAPALVLAARAGPAAAPTTIVLPGPPRELQPMFDAALHTVPVRALLARTREHREGTLLLYGIPESEIAATLRAASAASVDLSALEITTCLHRGEVEVATRYAPAAQTAYEEFVGFVARRHPRALFSRDGETVDQLVAGALLGRHLTIAVAESCTGGLLAARLTDLPGSSQYLRGGIVAYSNDAKRALAGVDGALIERHGAVSAEVAAALAHGARERLAADVGVGITGVAGPGGGTPAKPVGLVWLSVVAPERAVHGRRQPSAGDVRERPAAEITRSVQLPGSRADVRERATTVAMHLVRRLLLGDPPASARGVPPREPGRSLAGRASW
jgi:nicotinamide-nucleotide amidase